jgi:putative transposase
VGLKSFPHGLRAVLRPYGPNTHRSPAHLLRDSLDFVSHEGRNSLPAGLRNIYRALDVDAGEAVLGAFEDGLWGHPYLAIGQSGRRA